MSREDVPDSPDLTDGETMTNGATDTESDCDLDDPKMFKLASHLSFAEKRIVELKSELGKQYTRASEAERRAAATEHANSATDPEPLRQMQLQVLVADEDKKATLRTLEEAKRQAAEAKDEVESLHNLLEKMGIVNRKLSTAFEEARSVKPHQDSAVVNQLHATITASEAKIEQLVDKNDQLSAQNFALSENLKKPKADASRESDETVFYKFKNQNLESELLHLREQLLRLEKDHVRLREDHMLVLTEHATAPHNTRLQNEDTELVDKFNDIRRCIAWHITDLDLSKGNIRVFTCSHENLRDVPDGQNSTCEMTVRRIADDLYQEWRDDNKFIKEYNNARRTLLAHHRAHEKAEQGRGVASWFMKKEFILVDEKRGAPIKY